MELSPELLIERAAARGLDLDPATARLDASGLDFMALHARDASGVDWIVRAPRRPSVVARAAVEAWVLRLVAPRLPVAVPDWRVYDDELIAYPRLAGAPAWEITADLGLVWALRTPESPSEVFVDDLARLVAALWAVAPDDARDAGVPTRELSAAREELAGQLEVARAHHPIPERVWARWQRFVNERRWPTEARFVHGDLHPGHLLIDGDERVTGVLDWTEGHVGDPSVDLAGLTTCFGEALLDRVLGRLDAMGVARDPGLREHAAERAALSPALMLHFAVTEGTSVPVAPALAMIAAQDAALAGG